MKKLLITILLSGSLLLVSTLVVNSVTKPVFATEDVGDNSGEGGGLETAKKDVQLNFGQTAKDKDVIGTTDYNPEDGSAGFGALLSQVLRIVVVFAAIILFLYLIWGGIEWITSGGDSSKIEKAKNRITQSIIGILVLAGVIALFVLMQSALNFQVFTFSGGNSGSQPGSGGNSGSCTITGELENDGTKGNYCTNKGAAMVKCIPPVGIYKYNHYTPCNCIDGPEFNRTDLNFTLCN
jgi:amino acid transporter